MKVLRQLAVFSLVSVAASGAFAQDVFREYDVVHDSQGNIVMNTHDHCVHTDAKSGLAKCDIRATKPVPVPVRMERRPEPKMYK